MSEIDDECPKQCVCDLDNGNGPYRIKNKNYWWHVDGLGEEQRLNQWAYKIGAEWWARQLNTAHAEGRKAEREKLSESILSNIGRSMEALASIEHDRWSRWHIYAKNNWTPENIVRWNRQSVTKYQDLTEEEKEKDRQEVRNYLWVITNAISSVVGKSEDVK